MANTPTTADYLNELANQKSLLAAKLAAEGTGATNNDTFNTLVEQAQTLHGTDKEYNPNSEKAQSGKAVAQAIANIEIPEGTTITVDQKYNAISENAQSGIAVAEGIDNSVGDINTALASLVEPSEIDPEIWMNETVGEAIKEIKSENEVTIADQIKAATTNLSTANEANIKKQIAEAVENLDFSTRKAFLLNAKRITDGNIVLEENTIYAIAKTPADNTLTVYDLDTLEPIVISDKHYCIFVGTMGSDIAGAVCATVLSYPSLDPQLYVVKNDTLQGTMTWTGTAICSIVKNASIE